MPRSEHSILVGAGLYYNTHTKVTLNRSNPVEDGRTILEVTAEPVPEARRHEGAQNTARVGLQPALVFIVGGVEQLRDHPQPQSSGIIFFRTLLFHTLTTSAIT